MTANEDDAALDLDAIEDKWLQQCGSCDAGLPLSCSHPSEDYRPVMLRLVSEIRRLRLAGLLPGPDDIVVSREDTHQLKERIRELEAELARNEAALMELSEASAALRADHTRLRHLLGPDDIAVNREALRKYLRATASDSRTGQSKDFRESRATLRAALSQPHPAQEQQT
jgi:hypothetical protein